MLEQSNGGLGYSRRALQRDDGRSRYHEFMGNQRDWLLGRNPWGVSMFTMIPEHGAYPKDVHLMANSIVKRQVRGGLVDGPVYRRIFQSLKGVSVTTPDPFAAFQDERGYITTILRTTRRTNQRWTAQPQQFCFGHCKDVDRFRRLHEQNAGKALEKY